MKNLIKHLSLSSYGLRYKLRIGFYLMSVLPILICVYLISAYILPIIDIKLNIGLLVIVSVFVAVSGFFLVRQMVDPIINIASQAKTIAKGDVDHRIKIERNDEIGDLGYALNQLTLRMKDDMHKLKRYSEETKEINLEINRKVVALSGLLQISSFISEGTSIEQVFNLSMERIAQIGESDLAFLLLQKGEDLVLKSASGLGAERLINRTFDAGDDSLFAVLIKNKENFFLNNYTTQSKAIEEFKKEFGLKCALIIPVFIRNKISGLAGIGNNKGFEYKTDELRLMDIFVKQIIIAIENDALIHRVNHLEIRDALTGLYNESFIRTRLDEEIKRAIIYQRPCSFFIFRVDRYKELCDNFSIPMVESALKKIAVALKRSIGDIDKASRFADCEFAIVLPEKNKRQAEVIAEEIRKKIEYLFEEEPDMDKRITVSVGVSENPIDGMNSLDLINKAKESLDKL